MLDEDLALLTDFYELTMAQSYFRERMFQTATFSLFIRKYPPNRGFFVSSGLEDVLRYLEGLHFGPEAIGYLHRTGIFADDFLDFLGTVRFTGEVLAVPEGRLFFVDEPVLEVTAPIIESQLVETFIINQVNFQSMIATKAARCFHAAKGKGLVDFSLRRTHGTDAGMKAARASYIAGFLGTSNVLAGKTYGIPVVGTVAHSYITSFPREIDSFRAFVRSFPERSTLLIDTYDTVAGARKAVEVGKEMSARGERLQGVRIDSGDLLGAAHEVRRILDESGFGDVKIIGSGGLDEYDLERLTQHNAPFDAYGMGTHVGTSADAPWTDMAYKLVRYAGRPVLKLSTGKVTLPDEKQVYRNASAGLLESDTIALRSERLVGVPLLQRFMTGGRIAVKLPSLEEIREAFQEEFARLNNGVKAIREPDRYPVALSAGLQTLKSQMEAKLVELEVGWEYAGELGES